MRSEGKQPICHRQKSLCLLGKVATRRYEGLVISSIDGVLRDAGPGALSAESPVRCDSLLLCRVRRRRNGRPKAPGSGWRLC